MTTSKCVVAGCGGTSFELVANEPHGSKWQLYFVQCAKCGGVVGVQEYSNISAAIIEQNKAIEAIANKIGISVKLTTR